MQRRTQRFNMVEVVLAIGVIAIGICSIMALFPVGFKATQDSVAQSYAADSADQLLHWYAAQAKNNWASFTAAGYVAHSRPGTGESDNWTATMQMGDTHIERHDSIDGLYRVTVRRGTPPDDLVDYEGIYRIWREQVTHQYVNSGGTISSATMDYDTALAINLEASWPAALPYTARSKELYRLEIFRYLGN